jgi:hypothetical protein
MKKYVALVVVLLFFISIDVIRPGDVVSRACPRRTERTQVRARRPQPAQKPVGVAPKKKLLVVSRQKSDLRSSSPATSTDASVDDEDVPAAPASFEGYAGSVELFEAQLKKNNLMSREEKQANSVRVISLVDLIDSHLDAGKPGSFNNFARPEDHLKMYNHGIKTQMLRINMYQLLLNQVASLVDWSRLQDSILSAQQSKERFEQKVMQFDDCR